MGPVFALLSVARSLDAPRDPYASPVRPCLPSRGHVNYQDALTLSVLK